MSVCSIIELLKARKLEFNHVSHIERLSMRLTEAYLSDPRSPAKIRPRQKRQRSIVVKSFVVLPIIQATEEDGSDDEDLDDEAMMELDKSLAALFSEQKKKTQAKKDEKTKIQKEKTLVRDFKIKVPYPQSVLRTCKHCGKYVCLLSPEYKHTEKKPSSIKSRNHTPSTPKKDVSLPSLSFPDVVGVGPGRGVRGPAGWQSSCAGFGWASAQHHRPRNELRQRPAGAGLPPPSCRHLQVMRFNRHSFQIVSSTVMSPAQMFTSIFQIKSIRLSRPYWQRTKWNKNVHLIAVIVGDVASLSSLWSFFKQLLHRYD